MVGRKTPTINHANKPVSQAFKREVRSVLLPLWRWWPVLAVLVAVAVTVTKKLVSYMTPLYRSSATIQIDNRDNGIETFQVFAQQAAPSKTAATGLTEIEILQSQRLVGNAIDSLGWGLSVFRVGEMKTSELYEETPFIIRFEQTDSLISEQSFWLEFQADESFRCATDPNFQTDTQRVFLDQPFKLPNSEVRIYKNQSFLLDKPTALQPGNRFQIVLRSREKVISEVLSHELFIKALDKENTLLQVVYSNPVAKKSRDFVRALMSAYIAESHQFKMRQAKNLLFFLDEQIAETAETLQMSEMDLSVFRGSDDIGDSEMELDASFKERTQYNMREVNFDIQESEIRRIYNFLRTGKSLQDFAPNFEALQDPLFKEAFVKAQALELQKQDLSIKYTARSAEIRNVQTKIDQLRSFLNESVTNALENIDEKKGELRGAIGQLNEKIKSLPERQRREFALQRNLKNNEQLYLHLLEKRAELSIATASVAPYHRIIEYPDLPKTPYSPNKTLLLGLAVFSALGVGMMLVYSLERLFARVQSADDLEFLETFPVVGWVFRLYPREVFRPQIMENLLSELTIWLKKTDGGCRVISICSSVPGEGKTFLCQHIAEVFARAGQRVLLVDAHLRKGDLATTFDLPQRRGISEFILEYTTSVSSLPMPSGIENLDIVSAGQFHAACTAPALSSVFDKIHSEVAPNYNLLLVDTPPLGISSDALPILAQSDFNLFVVRNKKTRLRQVKQTALSLQTRQIPSIYFVLNDVPLGRGFRKFFSNKS